jgi:hypothetical protein
MRCQYCQKRLGVTKLLKGETFCSAEHRELHLDAQAAASYERLRASFNDPLPKEPLPERSEPKPEPALGGSVHAALVQAGVVPTESVEASPIRVSPLVETQARKAVEEAAPTLEIASLIDAVGSATGNDLPQAPFLPELPVRQDRADTRLASYAEELVTASVQLPVSAMQGRRLRSSSSLTLDVTPAQPPVELPRAVSQPTWRPVPEGYPPVVVSAFATLVLDSNQAELIALPLGEPCRGKGPVPLVPHTSAIEPPAMHPRLPSQQESLRPTSEVPVLLARPPQAPYVRAWEPRLGSGSALPAIAGALASERTLLKMVEPARHQNPGSLPSFSFLAEIADMPVSKTERRIASAVPLPTSIVPRHKLWTAQAPLIARTLPMAEVPSQLAEDFTTTTRSEPSSDDVACGWQTIVVDSQLPPIATARPLGSFGLTLATEALPLGRAGAPNFPPNIEIVPAVPGTVSLLLLSRPLHSAEPAMPLWSGMRPVSCQVFRQPAPENGPWSTFSAAHLHPTLPSPLSLVTWSQSLAISIPACSPSTLSKPAPIELIADPGRVHALRPWAPSRRGHRLIPLLPQPGGVSWVPVAPLETPLRPPTLKPILPGSQGTAPPCLAGVRVAAASMPMLPAASSPFVIDSVTGESVTGLVPQGLCPEDTTKLVSINMGYGTAMRAGELPPESETLLPSFSAERHVPAIAVASSSNRIWCDPIPGVPSVGNVEPYLSLQRLAWAVTARLPEVERTPGQLLSPTWRNL